MLLVEVWWCVDSGEYISADKVCYSECGLMAYLTSQGSESIIYLPNTIKFTVHEGEKPCAAVKPIKTE